MRTSSFVLSILLATAAFAFLPSADAQGTCTFKSPDGCGGWVCTDVDRNGSFSDVECVSKSDIDRCQYQSDCCPQGSLWCPEPVES